MIDVKLNPLHFIEMYKDAKKKHFTTSPTRIHMGGEAWISCESGPGSVNVGAELSKKIMMVCMVTDSDVINMQVSESEVLFYDVKVSI